MAAVAIVKNPSWAHVREHPAPLFTNGEWVERPDNSHTFKVWENFNKEEILKDFFDSFTKN
jgi:hypothetical protein